MKRGKKREKEVCKKIRILMVYTVCFGWQDIHIGSAQAKPTEQTSTIIYHVILALFGQSDLRFFQVRNIQLTLDTIIEQRGQ